MFLVNDITSICWIWNYFQAWKTSKQEFNRCWWSIEDGCPCRQNADVDLQNLIESRTDLESSESDSFIDEILSNNKQNSELKIEKQPVGKRKKRKEKNVCNKKLSLVSEGKIWSLRWNCPISHSRPCLIITASSDCHFS